MDLQQLVESFEPILPDNTAVLFADLNGLKQTNDNGGYANGDRLLKKAANILKEVFPDGDIYRAGGDEFMVRITGIPRKYWLKSWNGSRCSRQTRRMSALPLAAVILGMAWTSATR